jgi:hypothetical protein
LTRCRRLPQETEARVVAALRAPEFEDQLFASMKDNEVRVAVHEGQRGACLVSGVWCMVYGAVLLAAAPCGVALLTTLPQLVTKTLRLDRKR